METNQGITPSRTPLLNPLLLRILQLVAVPAAILLAAALAVAASHTLPRSLSGLIGVGPYIVLLLGTAISAWFNRSRALIMLASLLAAYAGYNLAAGPGSCAESRGRSTSASPRRWSHSSSAANGERRRSPSARSCRPRA